jgi:hypothetical protein
VGRPQVFRSPAALAVWVVWLLFAVANWIDLAIQGRGRASVVAAAVLLLATAVAYVTALRPRIIADDTGITIVNPLRDHRVGWAGVAKVDLADLLRVHCAWHDSAGEHAKAISVWAVHYSRRRQLAAAARARRAAARSRGFATPFGRDPGTADSPAKAEADMIVRVLGDYAAAAAPAPPAPPGAPPPPPPNDSTWPACFRPPRTG